MEWKRKGVDGFNSMFEGEYLNGKKWNGIVKTFYNCGDASENKIINGKRI